MIQWTFTFFVLALVAGFFGYSGDSAVVASVAQILFAAFMVLFIVSSFSHVLLRRLQEQ